MEQKNELTLTLLKGVMKKSDTLANNLIEGYQKEMKELKEENANLRNRINIIKSNLFLLTTIDLRAELFGFAK